MKPLHQRWLLELTSTPTAPGREQRIIAWVKRWAKDRKRVNLTEDRHGNLYLRIRGAKPNKNGPIFITAHMDHPAFYVNAKSGLRKIDGEFRGGVHQSFFVGSKVLLYHGDLPPQRGVIKSYTKPNGRSMDPAVVAEFSRPVTATKGDFMTWDVGTPRISGEWLTTPFCDDPLGVAAALSAFDELLNKKSFRGDVRLMLTRSEEIGFVGALAAMTDNLIPRNARLILLESPKALPNAPSGDGPVVRVGDRHGIFDPDLTYRMSVIADGLAKSDKSFKYQRKLMDGGTTEAMAYQAYGYTSGCLCVAIGNYHNMNTDTGKIEAERISLKDYHNLIKLLVAVGQSLDDSKKAPALKPQLDKLLKRRRYVLK